MLLYAIKIKKLILWNITFENIVNTRAIGLQLSKSVEFWKNEIILVKKFLISIREKKRRKYIIDVDRRTVFYVTSSVKQLISYTLLSQGRQ